MKPRHRRSGGRRPPALRALAATVAGLFASAVPAASSIAGEKSLEEKLLDNKYRHGDYGVYMGWHDPWDWQFDEHGSHAVPLGIKVRFRWLEWLRLEGDVTYYRQGEEPPLLVSLYQAPEFDGLLLSGMVQFVPHRTGLLRPYVGTGPVFASLGNDFLVFRPEVRAADPGNPDQFALASWSQMDVGWAAEVGVDFHLGRRWSPFVEYRHLFGALELEEGDTTIGSYPFDPEELNTLPTGPEDQGIPHSSHYDWSGPVVSAGLKIRF
jgi:hypothetical protein